MKYSSTRVVIGGYTNTNSTNPDDAFIGVVDTTGSFVTKRKIASSANSEKLTSLAKINDDIYFTLEISSTVSEADTNVAFGKATLGTASITIDWVNIYTNALYSMINSSMVVDDFNEL